MAIKRVHAKIYGRVQGVGFRYYARNSALELGISGWARNNWDGSVEVMAEGEEGKLARFLGVLREGPPRAEVEGIEYEWLEPENMSGRFYIK